MNKPRILVVENDPLDRASIVALLNHWQFQSYVVDGQGQALLQSAPEKAREYRCQLALVDMRLIDNNDPLDFSGLELITSLLPTVSIITSGYGDANTASQAIREKGAFSFFSKGSSPEILKQTLSSAAAKYCSSFTNLLIQPASISEHTLEILFPNRPEIPKDELADLLHQLFPEAKKLHLKSISSFKNIDFSFVPRPRSRIFLVRQDGRQPELVKVAREKKINQEVQRYREFVEGRLVGSFSPPLKASAALWDLGGTLYHYMGTYGVETFAHAFENNSAEALLDGLEKFFKITWSDLYAQKQRGRLKTVFQAYSDVWDIKWYYERLLGLKLPNPLDEMPEIASTLGIEEPITWLKNRLSDPNHIPKTHLAVTHGDFHGDNILVDDDGHLWVIDFERTGFGPTFQDFTELESDIINRMAGISEKNFTDLYKLALCCIKPSTLDEEISSSGFNNEQLIKVTKVLTGLRRIACEIGDEGNTLAYYWGILLNTLFRVSLLSSTARIRGRQMQALMFASILCHRIDHWDDEWPPANWPKLDA